MIISIYNMLRSFRGGHNMSDKYYRNTYINVDLAAINNNYRQFTQLHDNKTVIPVIKANGYGLGSVRIAQYLVDHGASFFSVATLDEAIELRMHGIKAQILILGVIPIEDINKAIQHRVAITVPSKSWLSSAIKAINDDNEKRLWLHIKLDTGMGRLGIKNQAEYHQTIHLIEQHEHLVFEGVYTHFACADEPGDSAQQQYQCFKTWVTSTDMPRYVHAQNSAGALMIDADICNAVRLGISLYGYYPSEYVKEEADIELQPSAELMTQIVQTKELQSGESVSYGSTYTAQSPIKIGIIPIGYADGYLRIMQGHFVNVKGQQCEVIGRVCMDQTIIKINDDILEGDEVCVISKQQDSIQSVDAIAKQQKTINYEVLCNLGRRLPRIYKFDNKEYIINDLLK